MLTIKLNIDNDALRLWLYGHAGAGKWGKDIVCAAASILTYTAAASAEQLYREGKLKNAPYIRLLPGSALVEMELCPETQGLMNVIRNGYTMLALRYPENVKLEESAACRIEN